jgi:hypothetical protein
MKHQSMYTKFVALFAIVFLISACAGIDPAPANAAKNFFIDTWAGKAVAAYMCTSNAAAAQTVKQGLEQLTNTLQGKATIDSSGLKFETSSQSGDTAQVKLTGKYKLTVPGRTDTTLEISETMITMKKEGDSWKVCGADW